MRVERLDPRCEAPLTCPWWPTKRKPEVAAEDGRRCSHPTMPIAASSEGSPSARWHHPSFSATAKDVVLAS